MANGVEIATAYVSLIPSFRGGEKTIGDELDGLTRRPSEKSGRKSGELFAKAWAGPVRAVGAAALGIFAADKVKDFFKSSIDEARESQKVSALTTQVIKSTGSAANVSANQVGNLAQAISNKVGIDDEAIQSGQNMLLTFKNIRNEAGAGNDIFNQTSKTMVDMAASMAAASGGQVDFKSAAIQLGKALNDPVKGLTALSRVGVTFDAQQTKQIKTLVASGNTLGAQKVILRELSSEFGGAAAASTTAGEKMTVAWKNLQEQIGTAALPYLDKAEKEITKKVIPAVSLFITQMQNGKGRGGEFAAEMKHLGAEFKSDVLPVIKDTVKIGTSLLHFFEGLPGPVQKNAIAFGAISVTALKLVGTFKSLTGVSMTFSKQAKATAGVAGVGALATSMFEAQQKGNSLSSTLSGALGGAMLGLSVGGPIGALIGGAGGAGLTALAGSLNTTKEKADQLAIRMQQTRWAAAQKSALDEVKQSLDGVSGAYTHATRAAVLHDLQANKLLFFADRLKIPADELVSAVMGEGKARADVANKISKQREMQLRLNTTTEAAMKKNWLTIDAMQSLRQGLGFVTKASARKRAEDQKALIATNGLRKSLKLTVAQYRATPKSIRTDLRLHGLPQTRKDLQGFVRKYGRKSIATASVIAKINGIEVANRTLRNWAKSTKKSGNDGGTGVKQGFDEAIRRASGTWEPEIKTQVTRAANGAKGTAHSGGTAVGDFIISGFEGGVGRPSTAPAIFASLVSRTIAAGHQAADSHSPSRKTRKLGGYLADGLVEGMDAGTPAVVSASRRMVSAAIPTASSRRSAKAAQALGAGGDMSGAAFTLVLDDGTPLTGYISDIADDRVRANTSMQQQTVRASR